MDSLCRSAWGCFFLFCLSFYLSAIPSPAGRRTAFRSSGFSDSPSICSQLAHTSPTRLVTRFAGVVPLPGPQNRTQGHHRCELGFSPQNELTPPPKGEGLGFIQFGVVRVPNAEKPGAFPQEKTDASYPRASLGSCLWRLLLTTGQHGFNGVDLRSRRWCSPSSPGERPSVKISLGRRKNLPCSNHFV